MSTPSILSDIPIFHEIARDSAVFVDPNNPNEIAETVNKVYFDQLTLENLKIKVFDRAQDFNPVNFINQFSLLIKNI
jgi:glycosyltransferase involved in cell wall biosynthesis